MHKFTLNAQSDLKYMHRHTRMRKHTVRDSLSAQEVEPEWAAHCTHSYSANSFSDVNAYCRYLWCKVINYIDVARDFDLGHMSSVAPLHAQQGKYQSINAMTH